MAKRRVQSRKMWDYSQNENCFERIKRDEGLFKNNNQKTNDKTTNKAN